MGPEAVFSTTGLRLSIAVIDANPLLADGISALLGQDSSFAAQAIVLGDNAEQTWHQGFDVIVIDPTQTTLSPQEIARDLDGHGASLVAYSSSLSMDLARACIAAGFHGVLPKTVSFEVLKAALATTAQGGIFIDAAFSAAIAQRLGAEDPPKPAEDACLSERELSVLKSVAHGKTMKEIGKELALSSKTVETYKARGSMKLNLSGRRQIVEFAIAQGWVESARAQAS
ncbi:response regulator transcription factor [Tabrizicola sp.]|uniref:response regulator transcription factor n=1 Tax=Tabrizicola sp. TaxID=2005166 RepID=UPI00286C722D|nr:response regulator transcription factor [Tabrizicola sp.]